MESSTHFDLQVAITEHLQEIDQNHLLNHEEWDELFDHFLEDAEALTEKGLTEREAFAVSKLRFGETTLVRQEYERVKPFGHLRKTVIACFLGIFTFFLISSLISTLSLLSYHGGKYLQLSDPIIKYGDLGLKIFCLGGVATLIVQRINRQLFFHKREIWVIPLLGLLAPMIMSFIFRQVGFPEGKDQQLIGQIFSNTTGISLFWLVAMVAVSYILIFKERKQLATL